MVTPSPFIPLPLNKGKGEEKERGADAPLGLPALGMGDKTTG